MTGTGLGGWLNYAQQAIFGSYSWKFSVILAVGFGGGAGLTRRVRVEYGVRVAGWL